MSSYSITQMQEKMLKSIDTNKDGSVTKEELVTNRPKEMSEEQANQVWSDLDTGDTGSLTASEFISALQSLEPPQGPPPEGFEVSGSSDETSETDSTSSTSSSSSTEATDSTDALVQAVLAAIEKYSSSSVSSTMQDSSSSDEDGQSLSDLFNKIDSDGDGSVSKDEFISSRPEDVSEEQADEMWSSLDTESAGSLTESQFLSAMESRKPPQGPPPGDFDPREGSDSESSSDSSTAADSSSATSSSTGTTATDEMVQALMEAINKYSTTMSQNGLSTQASSLSSSLISVIG
jgi:Ca2+-binding EF-hand superfamily protein